MHFGTEERRVMFLLNVMHLQGPVQPVPERVPRERRSPPDGAVTRRPLGGCLWRTESGMVRLTLPGPLRAAHSEPAQGGLVIHIRPAYLRSPIPALSCFPCILASAPHSSGARVDSVHLGLCVVWASARLYAFDVHCNAYFPVFILLHGKSLSGW